MAATWENTSARYFLAKVGYFSRRSVRHIKALLRLVNDFWSIVCATSKTSCSTLREMSQFLAMSLIKIYTKCLISFSSETASDETRSMNSLLVTLWCKLGWAVVMMLDRKSMHLKTNCFLSLFRSKRTSWAKNQWLNLERQGCIAQYAVMRHSRSGHTIESLFKDTVHFRHSSATMREQVASGMTLRKYSLSKMVECALKILKSALPLNMFNPCSRVLTIYYKTCGVATRCMFQSDRIQSSKLMPASLSMRCVVCVPSTLCPLTPSNTNPKHSPTMLSQSLNAGSNFSKAQRLVARTRVQFVLEAFCKRKGIDCCKSSPISYMHVYAMIPMKLMAVSLGQG